VRKPVPSVASNDYERDSNYDSLTNPNGQLYSFQKHLVTADGKQPLMVAAALQQQHSMGRSSYLAPPQGDDKTQSKDDKTSSSSASSNSKKPVLFNFHPILRSTYRDLKMFVSNPCPPNVVTRCYIERNRSGSKMLAPYFSLCADLEGNSLSLSLLLI
jgi:hypothetical protein